MHRKRLLPLAGIVFVGLFIAAMVLNNSSPDADASAARLFAYYDGHGTREILAAVLLVASTPFLVFFGAALATARGPDEPRTAWELVVLAGATLTAGLLQVVGYVHLALVDAPGQDISGDAIRVLATLDGHIVATTGLGVMMLGAAGTLLTRAGSRRLAWPALVLGLALFVPLADFFAFVLTGVWILVASITLSRGAGRRTPSAAQRGAVGVAAAVCALAVLGSSAAAGPAPVYQAPQSYYLALGDSMAYGFQPTKAKPGARPSDFRTGYVDVFAARLRKLAPAIKLVNYSCPGESTVTFSRGGCPTRAEGIKLHDPYRGAQLKAALSFLRAHPGEVSPITVTLWGAELVPLSAKGKRAGSAIASVAVRFTTILRQLRAAAPNAEIIVTGAWNPEADKLKQVGPLYRSVGTAIARAAAKSRARVANVSAALNGSGNLRTQKARLCRLTFYCSKGDPHPTDAGYRAMAGAFLAASGYGQSS
jgi:lysophospholipase L1-like esterase